MSAIAISNLTKHFTAKMGRERVVALSDVSFEVEPGEIFGLLGPNGAGKTTLVKILLSIVRATSGEVHLLGENNSDHTIRRRVGYLPENHRFPGYLTGGQALSIFGRLAGLSGSHLRRRSDELLTLVQMDRWRKTQMKKYSKGMQQRLGLAVAMVNDPDLLLLDEPTDGVDPVGRKEIRDLLERLKEQGKTIFLNSHLLSEVEMVCDRVAILNQGKLIKVGTVGSLTEQQCEYMIEVTAWSEAVEGRLREATRAFSRQGNRLSVTLSEPKAINPVIDLLRINKMEILSVIPRRETLEESFLALIARPPQ